LINSDIRRKITQSNEPVYVSLSGGLGNQLFQWAAGLTFSRALGVGLVLSDVEVGDRGFQLGRFGLLASNEELADELRMLILRRPKRERFAETVVWKIARRNLAKRLVVENGLPFDKRFEKFVRPGSLVKGGFQSEKYFEAHRNEVFSFLRGSLFPSATATSVVGEQLGSDWVVIHVRRGDYLRFPHVFSIPGQNYFDQARELLAKFLPAETNYLVLSDDLAEAKKVVPWADVYLGQELDDPVDVLWLISQARYLIGSNSSLSWWGSFLADRSQVAFFPTPWFSDSDLPDFDLLPSWGNVLDLEESR
jgi:hypothetical protein